MKIDTEVIDTEVILQKENFKYHRSIIKGDGEIDNDVAHYNGVT